jgi:hypothetical protein
MSWIEDGGRERSMAATLVARLAVPAGGAGAQPGAHSASLLPQQFSVKQPTSAFITA